MKSILLLSLCLIISTAYHSQISIDNTTYSSAQLVDGVLIPAASGTTVSNIQFGGVLNSSNRYQLGYFGTAGNTLTEMGISGGVVLSTGNTSDIPLALGSDPGAAAQMSTGYTSCTAGEIRESGTCPTNDNDVNVLVGAQNYYNASILEFDFVPVTSSVSFNYIFGSEEYRDNNGFINYQCSSYNDKFGFLISGPGITGGQGYNNDARNIALLANGSEVGINSVNQGEVGSSGGAPSASNCQNANPAWLENVSTAEFLGAIDGTGLNGNTMILTAEQTGLTPGATYHIRLIISDANDGAYDSVVYLEEGSFTTESPCTPPNAPTANTVQPDCTIPTGTITITAPTGGTIEYSIDGATYQSSTVFSGLIPGDYNVTAQDNITLCTSAITIVTVDPAPTPPLEPATACYETATFNTTSCVWDITGTQPIEPAVVNCWDNFVFNTTTCVWDNTGTQAAEPATTCYETATFNTTSCVWDITGTQPIEPSVACYEMATFNSTSCVWDVSGTQPVEPSVECYESTMFNVTTCVWDITGTQDSAPMASVTAQPNCTTPTGTITVTAPIGANVQYSLDGITFQSSTIFLGLTPDTYNIVSQDASIGCASISISITINNVPDAQQVDAGPDVTIQQNESTTLTAVGAGSIAWETSEFTNSIIVSPLMTTNYCVSLLDSNGCVSSDCVNVIVLEDCGELYIPTAFSPDGDENNDLYQIRINASCVQSMQMQIYDRWGELIIEMNDINETWDGTYKSEPLNNASFAYVLKITLSNNPEEQIFKGNITLIK